MYNTKKLYFGKIATLDDFDTDFGFARISGCEVGIFKMNHNKSIGHNLNEENKKYFVFKTPKSLISSLIMKHRIGKKMVVDVMPLDEALKKYHINYKLKDTIKDATIFMLCLDLQSTIDAEKTFKKKDIEESVFSE